jgi:ribosomal protein S21
MELKLQKENMFDEAFKWLKRSTDLNFAFSMLFVGEFYEKWYIEKPDHQ